MKKIAVGSTNQAKLNAVESVFSIVLHGEELKIVGESVPSGVDDQPLNDDTTVDGALNRMKAVEAMHPDSYYVVGLEGGVETNSHGSFLKGWATVREVGKKAIGIGHSGGIRLPDSMAAELQAGAELGPLIVEQTKDASHRSSVGGANGFLTGGLYTREKEFTDALLTAVGSLRAENNQ